MGFADLCQRRAAMKKTDLPFLIAGAAGLLAALYGAVGGPRLEGARDPAAIVDGVPIPREALARAVLALEADSRNPVTLERQAAVLERLIEEELLVQHGVELGLAETDFAARRALVQSVLALAIAERAGDEPTDAELRAFFRENAGFFAPTARVSGSVVFIAASPDANERIETARAALARGESAAGLGDAITVPIPRGALSRNEWRSLVGADAADAMARLAPGEVSAPIATAGGVYVVRADGFISAPAPAYEDVAEQVRNEWERRQEEAAVRAYIDQLKRAARIERRRLDADT